MRTTSAIAAICIPIATAICSGVATAEPVYHEYVALGDSWSADSTLNPVQLDTRSVPLGCAQSRYDYPKQVAAALHVRVFRDATCANSTTDDMTGRQRTAFTAGYNSPEFDRLTRTTDLVTLGIGANDSRTAAMFADCLTTDPAAASCARRYVRNGVDRISRQIDRTEPKVVATIAGIHARAPHARVLLVNYLDAIDPGRSCPATNALPPTDITFAGRRLRELNAMLAQVSQQTGTQLVDTYTTKGEHDICAPAGVRYAEGPTPWTAEPIGPADPFHPNELGADHQASSVLRALGR